MEKILKRLFCNHSEMVMINQIYGDRINQLNCRSIWRCEKCGKTMRSHYLDRLERVKWWE